MEALKTADEQTGGAIFKKIFNWHNGLMIEDHLNNLTDSDFKLLDDDLYCSYKFVNSEEQYVTIDEEGSVSSDISLPEIFITRVNKRLARTEKMFSMFGYD